MIVTLIDSLTEGSLFSQYHSGASTKILIFQPHSQLDNFAFSVHRSLIFSKSSLLGMNDDNFIKYHFLISSKGVIGLTSHKQDASYS
jgi:hypothetical protein